MTQALGYTWHRPKDLMPTNGQECLLLPSWALEGAHLVTAAVFGPIPWNEDMGKWFDLFATPEAGTVVEVDMVGLWCDWKGISPDWTQIHGLE